VAHLTYNTTTGEFLFVTVIYLYPLFFDIGRETKALFRIESLSLSLSFVSVTLSIIKAKQNVKDKRRYRKHKKDYQLDQAVKDYQGQASW
jgi:hypothetical protein